MTFDQFKTQATRLAGTYGANAYPQERLTLLWKAMESLEAEDFKGIIDQLIGEERHPPMLDKFRELAGFIREKKWNAQKHQVPDLSWNPRPACSDCRDNGVYVCSRKERGGLWAFRCHCLKGEQDARRATPQFKSDHAKEYIYFDIVAARRSMEIV